MPRSSLPSSLELGLVDPLNLAHDAANVLIFRLRSPEWSVSSAYLVALTSCLPQEWAQIPNLERSKEKQARARASDNVWVAVYTMSHVTDRLSIH